MSWKTKEENIIGEKEFTARLVNSLAANSFLPWLGPHLLFGLKRERNTKASKSLAILFSHVSGTGKNSPSAKNFFDQKNSCFDHFKIGAGKDSGSASDHKANTRPVHRRLRLGKI